MAKALDSLVRERYASAVAQGALLFSESVVHFKKEDGVQFEVRYVPALANKPNNKPKETLESKGFVNPFLPFDTRLFVKSLGSSHNLLLNKYCVVPYHLLITTASYEQQGEPLTEKDFSAVLDTTNNMSRQHIVFYNSGEESGASQPHKHLQLLPMPEYLDLPPLLGRWLDDNPLPGTMHTAKSLPFANFGVWLGTGPPTPSTLLAAYCSALKALTDRYGQNASYNMILVANTLVLFPRHHSRWHGIGVNSLGYSGLFLCKSNEEMALIENVGVLSILTSVGFPVTLLQKS